MADMKNPKEPYGPPAQADYADPGYQADKKKRYPLDSADHVRAAWNFINIQSYASKYNASQLRSIIQRIRSAAKKFNITLSAPAPVTSK